MNRNIENLENEYSRFIKIAKSAILATGERNEEEIKDICSESICRLLEKERQIDDRKGKVENYLYTTAMHESYSQYKRKKRWRNVDITNCAMSTYEIDKRLDARSRLESCDIAIKGFNLRYQKIYHMLKEGYSNEEMSKELGISLNNIYLSVHYLRTRLRGIIA